MKLGSEMLPLVQRVLGLLVRGLTLMAITTKCETAHQQLGLLQSFCAFGAEELTP
jgi:hypothetical protein